MPRDPASDMDAGLEVKPNPGTDSHDAASASGDPGAAGRNGQGGQDELRNLRREMERKLDEYRAETRSLAEVNQRLVDQLAARQAPQPEPETPPFSEKDLVEAQNEGNFEKFQLMLSENHEFHRRKDRENVQRYVDQTVERRTRNERVQAYLSQHYGLDTMSPELRKEVQTELSRVKQMDPGLDDKTAEVVAIGVVRGRALNGEIDVEDFRAETRQRTSSSQPPAEPSGRFQESTVDWDAPNRGLPDHIVQKLHKYNLGKALQRGANAEQEKHYRQVIWDVVAHENHIGKKRAR